MLSFIQLKLSILVLSVTLLSSTCIAQTSSMDGWPDWVIKGMAKEVEALELKPVQIPFSLIATKLPGKTEAPQRIDDGWYFITDIDADIPVECYIYTTALDLSTLTNVLLENNIDAVAKASNGTVGVSRVHHIGAGAISGTPYLAAEKIYTVITGNEKKVGFSKVRAAAKGDIAFACSHNYLGYRESFAQTFVDFVSNTTYVDPKPAPYYEAITQFDINTQSVGINYYALTEDKRGKVEITSKEAMLSNVGGQYLSSADGINVSLSEPNGSLINARSINVVDGEIKWDSKLTKQEDGSWLASGKIGLRSFSKELDSKISPASDRLVQKSILELLNSDFDSKKLNVWVPSQNPMSFTQMTITRDDSRINGQAEIAFGPVNYLGQFDKHGTMKTAVVNAGSTKANMKRLWTSGVPK